MYTGQLNRTLPQDKVIDFGLKTTLAAKDPPGIGFEATIRTHREQRWRSAILKRDRTPSSFLVLSLLLLSGNVELNPGPHYKHPCGSCTKPVKPNQRGVQCDICDIWYHTRCMLMSPDRYEGLATLSAVWICSSCGVPNFSSTLLDADNNMELSNSFSSLTQGKLSANPSSFSHSDMPGVLYDSSLPRTNSAKSSRSVKKNISILNVNCQSLPAKRETFLHLINDAKPDIIIGTESWLSHEHSNNECFPTVTYQVERRDRPNDPHGGVFIAAKKDLVLVRESNLETECELLWCNIHITGCKTLHIGAYYRPHVGDENSLQELDKSLSLITPAHDILLGGNFNFPGWDWKNKTLKTCPFPTLHHQFGDLLDDKGLIQMVEEPTRSQNILDLVITNNPSRVRQVKVLPGI